MNQEKQRHRPRRLALRHGYTLSAVTLMCCIAGAAVQAAEANAMRDTALGRKHQLSIGAARQDAEAAFFASSDNGAGAAISLNDLAIDDSDTTFYAEYRYRFRPRWVLALSAYSFSASGGRTLARDLDFNDIEFEAGATTEARLEADAYLVDVLYKAYESRALSLWVGGGVHALDLGATIRGDATINDNETEFEVANESLLAPVPNVRGVATWAFTERFGLALKAGWLSADVDDYSGDFTYAHLRGIYAVNDAVSLAIGYQYTDVDVTESRERGGLGFDVTLQGPTITFDFGF